MPVVIALIKSFRRKTIIQAIVQIICMRQAAIVRVVLPWLDLRWLSRDCEHGMVWEREYLIGNIHIHPSQNVDELKMSLHITLRETCQLFMNVFFKCGAAPPSHFLNLTIQIPRQ